MAKVCWKQPITGTVKRGTAVQRGAEIALGRSPLVGRPWPFCGIPITKGVVVLTQAPAHWTRHSALQTLQFCHIQRASSNFKTVYLKRKPSTEPNWTCNVFIFVPQFWVWCFDVLTCFNVSLQQIYLPWSSSLLRFEAISLPQPQAWGPSATSWRSWSYTSLTRWEAKIEQVEVESLEGHK